MEPWRFPGFLKVPKGDPLVGTYTHRIKVMPGILKYPGTGTTTWSYNMTDTSNFSSVAYVTITIPPATPIATDDAYCCPYNATLTVGAANGMLKNDLSDNAGANLTVVTAATQQPANGSVSLAPDGSFTFTPDT